MGKAASEEHRVAEDEGLADELDDFLGPDETRAQGAAAGGAESGAAAAAADAGADAAAGGDGAAGEAGQGGGGGDGGDAGKTPAAAPAPDPERLALEQRAATALADRNAFEKRLKDTRDYATRMRQRAVKLEQRLRDEYADALEDLGDDPGDLPDGEKPAAAAGLDPELQVRVNASLMAATRLHGKEKIEKLLLAPDSPYKKLEQQEPWVTARVMASAEPVFEALALLEERAFFDHYGRDIAAAKKKLREEIETEIRAEIARAEGGEGKGGRSRFVGVREARGAAGGAETPRAGEEAAHTPLSEILNPDLA